MTNPETTTPFSVQPSSRLSQLPAYVFAELDELKARARAQGADLIDLGMGNPDNPTPAPIVEAIVKGVQDPANHRYPNFKGKPEFQQAVAGWMKRRYGVDIDPATQVQSLLGSKEGLAHIAFAYIEEGDVSLVPTPYYPVHARATWLAGGDVFNLPLTRENNFLPDLSSIPDDVAKRAKLFFINYPNNPTAAIADLGFLKDMVAYCRQHQIVLVSDLAYGDVAFDGYRPPSILNVEGAEDLAIEFHSFSKTFNMAGWRIGFAVGNAQIISNLHAIKTNMDYGTPSAIQDGAIHALTHGDQYADEIQAMYKRRRDLVVEGFRELGWPVEVPKATMYTWLPVPQGYDSWQWCRHLIDEAGVVITPGIAFGSGGEGYFRVSLVSPVETLQAALERLKAKGIRYS